MTQAFLYVIGPTEPTSLQVVKIGWSHTPARRLAEIQAQLRDPLAILYLVEVDQEQARRIERTAHKTLAFYRLSGEWFSVTLAQAQAAISNALAKPMASYEKSITFSLSAPAYSQLSAFILANPGFTKQMVVSTALDEQLTKLGH